MSDSVAGALNLSEIFEIFGWSIAAALVMSVISGFVGSFVVMRKQPFLTEAIGHSAILGVALGHWASLSPSLSVLLFSVSLAFGLTWLAQNKTQEINSITAALMSFCVSLGVLLMSRHPGANQELTHVLFGDLLWLGPTDLGVYLLVAIPVIGFLLKYRKSLILMEIDESVAQASGLPVRRLNYSFMVCVSLVLAGSIKLVGVVLVIGLVTLPAMIASRWSSSLKQQLLYSPLVAFFAVALGVSTSIGFDFPVGPCLISWMGLVYLILHGLRRSQ